MSQVSSCKEVKMYCEKHIVLSDDGEKFEDRGGHEYLND